jgi:GrpB-like predicted nucleotidyltransferase (UPF0157 family)
MLLQEYKESWIADFNEIKKVITEVLLNLPVSIEHIGSTAIPQLAAKPIIDINIVYDKNAAFDELKIRLQKIGYYHAGNQGIPDREVFKRDNTTGKHNVLDFIAHHLYACPADSEELQRHILFRDYLIENEEARVLYQNLKYEIAAEADQDRKKYTHLKEVKAKEFVNSIIAKAKREKTANAQESPKR